MQLRKPGFEKWLKANAPPAGPLDGSGSGLEIEKAQEAFLQWPLLHEVEYEYVDTPEKARLVCDKQLYPLFGSRFVRTLPGSVSRW